MQSFLSSFLLFAILLNARTAICSISVDFESIVASEGSLVTNQIPGVSFSGAILAKPGPPEFGFTSIADGFDSSCLFSRRG